MDGIQKYTKFIWLYQSVSRMQELLIHTFADKNE